ncbi:glycosyltransferase family 4 protein [Parvularcula lutaonensis]|uniref:Glycosyltransferase family 4 protein n=1 Tax=Parvularcula lutaonensis TaxID=491923 RepID=A0ABV7M8N3_9PROT|nr:glycosyltransferase family 4 protein [Parvularcula lutaonensis]GGY44405.1 hypothetical protein GCM10007148_11630 [Parvularcula lutaonensis]
MLSGPHIALVSTFFPPFNFGGDGIYLERFAGLLTERGCQVTVVHNPDAYRLLAGKASEGMTAPEGRPYRVVPVEAKRPFLETLAIQQLGRPLATKPSIEAAVADADIIHYHNISLMGGPGVLSIGSALKIYTAHEHWLVCPSHILWRHNREVCDGRECFRCQIAHRRPPQLWRYTDLLEKQAAEVDAFIALSQASAHNHAEFGFRFPMQVLPSFLPADPAPQGEEEHLNGGVPYLFFAGRLEIIKGLQDVVPLFGPDAPCDLLIAGDGAYKDELLRIEPENSRVRWLGRLDPQEMGTYYRKALAVVTPSRCHEVFPLVSIEAFRAGTPIIARDLGAYREIVQETGAGFLFEKPEHIIDAVRKLMEGDTRERLGRLALEKFESRWSEDVAMKAYFDLLIGIAEKKGDSTLAGKLRKIA